MTRRFALEVPADSDYLTMARLFVGAAAEELGCGGDTADDLRLAVSEAAGALIDGGGPITVALSAEDAGAAVAVRGPGRPVGDAGVGNLVLGLELAGALLGGVTIDESESGTVIGFSAPADAE